MPALVCSLSALVLSCFVLFCLGLSCLVLSCLVALPLLPSAPLCSPLLTSANLCFPLLPSALRLVKVSRAIAESTLLFFNTTMYPAQGAKGAVSKHEDKIKTHGQENAKLRREVQTQEKAVTKASK